eukprot:1519529-Ditylum_brightwellii.AAC.1
MMTTTRIKKVTKISTTTCADHAQAPNKAANTFLNESNDPERKVQRGNASLVKPLNGKIQKEPPGDKAS